MTANYDAYIQPNIAPINKAESVFVDTFGPITVDNPSSYSELYGELMTEGSHQAKTIAEVVLVAGKKVHGILPKSSLWLPASAECVDVEASTIEFDELGIYIVGFQRTETVFSKQNTTTAKQLLPRTLGFILNTKASPSTQVVIPEGQGSWEQKALIIKGKRTTR